jgi:uncharacterized protein (TIGR03382 family)
MVHERSGEIFATNGNLEFIQDVDVDSVALTDGDAIAMAKDLVEQGTTGNLNYEREIGTLVVFPGKGKTRVAWHVELLVYPVSGMPARWNYFLDATDGSFIYRYDGLTTDQASGPGGNPRTAQNDPPRTEWVSALDVVPVGGGEFIMDTEGDGDPDTKNLRTLDMDNRTNGGVIVTGPIDPIGDAPINDAHGFAEASLNMMLDVMGFDSIDGAGETIQSRVHYDVQLNNAFWDGQQLTYGDGDGVFFFPLSGDIEVVAHEMNHGFTERFSGLIYANESGGMNESFSDVAGVVAEFYDEGLGADFGLGEDIMANGAGGLRFLCDPPADGISIDHYADYRNGMDVHFSSGISNKAFCLSTRRLGSGDPDAEDAHTVDSVFAAGALWYYANAFAWGPGTTFAQACDGIAFAGRDILGFPEDVLQLVIQSWLDVGVACDGQFPPPPPINCDEEFTTAFGTVTSPNFPDNYPNDADVTSCINPGFPVNLSFTDFLLETNFDFLTIFDGNTGEVFGTFTGTDTPPDIESSFLVLRFTSDFSVTRTGFSADWVPVVDGPPSASFTFVADNLDVQFTDTSAEPIGDLTAWAWDFGDGVTSVEQNPAHTYAAGGTYTVTLTVTGDDGPDDTATVSQDITVVPNNPPVAVFDVLIDDLNVDFDNDSTDDDGIIVAFAWDFGDGTTSTEVNPLHSYAAGGTYTVTLTATDDDGDTGSFTRDVTVTPNNPPVAGFTFDALHLDVDFFDASTDVDGEVVSYLWDFDDGTTSTDRNPNHVFPTGGTFSVTLTVTDEDGDSGSVTQDLVLVANVPPVVDFACTINDLTISCTNSSVDTDGTIVRLLWDFGDGTYSGRANPSHTFAAAGTYDVTLSMVDDDGDTGSRTEQITVVADQPPTAQFGFTTDLLSVEFTDTSTDADGTIVAWSWSFGDGATSTLQNPRYTYGAAGTYSVVLTVTDDNGTYDAFSTQVTVIANAPPIAGFSSATSELTATFTDASADSDGEVASWMWSFGDGTYSGVQSPSHTYARPGSYTVTLTVTDDIGDTASATTTVVVAQSNSAPSAGFNYGANGLVVTFRDTSSDANGSIVGWTWSFGDGATSSERHPIYTFGRPGTYTVALTVTDDDGETATTSGEVTVMMVNRAPVANFTYQTNSLSATFTDSSSDVDGSIASWQWSFGDGGASSDQNPNYSYANPGTYPVTLTITDDQGATARVTGEVRVVVEGSGGEDDGGCSATGSTNNSAPLWLALLFLGVVVTTRRRRDSAI